MSQVSQTQPQPRWMAWLPYWPLAASIIAVPGILFLALARTGREVTAAAMSLNLHAPDLALVASLKPAVKIHLFAALAALILGGLLMWARKGKVFHRIAGWGWVALVSLTAGSSIFITQLNRGHWSLLHLFTGWTLIVLPLAVTAAKRHEVVRHRRRMMGLFYGGFAINLFIAFIPGRTVWNIFFG